MDYQQALDYIHGTLKFGSKLGLSNILDLLNRLGNPHRRFQTIHVAGTNGKGSVAAMLTNIIHSSGYKVGMFTSPFLERFTERIQISLNEIKQDDLARITDIVKGHVDQMVLEGKSHPTEFEIVTALGFYYFAEQNVDYAVVEVGLGGRLDSTNVVDPIISVITSISYDHMDILGDTISQIAYEKGGIIKEGKPVVSYPQDKEALDVLKSLSEQRNARFVEVYSEQISIKSSNYSEQIFDFSYHDLKYENIRMRLPGRHQLLNAATALTAVIALKEAGHEIKDEAIINGMAETIWPGRMEKIQDSPLVILDGAHNVAGAQALGALINEFFAGRRITLMIGMLQDKDIDGVISVLCPLVDTVVVTEPDSPRAMKVSELSTLIRIYNRHVLPEPKIWEALSLAQKNTGQEDILIISGSLYLIGFVRSLLMKKSI